GGHFGTRFARYPTRGIHRERPRCADSSVTSLTFCLTAIPVPAQLVARDDGRFADSPLKPWFDHLARGKGLCCSFADGFSVQDVDWDTQDGHYRVRIYGQWLVVPDSEVPVADLVEISLVAHHSIFW